MKHTDNYYNNKVRSILKPIFDEIEAQYPGCTIYPYIVSWLRSNPYEKWVDFELCWTNKMNIRWSYMFVRTSTYEKLYEIIKNDKHLKENILHAFKEKCLKIQ